MEKPQTPQEMMQKIENLTAQLNLVKLKEGLLDEATFRFEILRVLERIATALEKK